MKSVDVPKILLLGIGGGGCRLAVEVRKQYGEDIRVVCADTDAMTSRMEPLSGVSSLLLGGSRLAGAGTGGDTVRGRLAAQDDIKNLMDHLRGVRTVVVLSCLGGGTGGGSTAEIVKLLHESGLTTFCFVTIPFSFEGNERKLTANRILPIIEENADSLVTISQDDLYSDVGDVELSVATRVADHVLVQGVTLLWRLLTSPGFIRMDPEKLHRMIIHGGNAKMGFASASGDNREKACVEGLKASAFLQKGTILKKANALLVGILAGSDLRLVEIGNIMSGLRAICTSARMINMGTVLDERFNGQIDLIVLAFERWNVLTEEERAAVALAPESSVADAPSARESDGAQPPPVVDHVPIHTTQRKGKSKVSKLTSSGKGKFWNVLPTQENGEDLDVPTYLRRRIDRKSVV